MALRELGHLKPGKPRLKPYQLTLAMLVAGWVPSLLMAFVSYSILRETLESRIINEELTLTRSVAQLIDRDFANTGEVMEHYQGLPVTQTMLRLNARLAIQSWLSTSISNYPSVDGMFVADRNGRLIESWPLQPASRGRDYAARNWLPGAIRAAGYYVSPVFPRPGDGKMICAIVISVRDARDGSILGFIGAEVAVERIGRRLASIDFAAANTVQLLDSRGFPLFRGDFLPNESSASPRRAELIDRLQRRDDVYFKENGMLYISDPIGQTGWMAVLEKPVDVVYQPAYRLLTWMSLLAGFLVIGTAFAARYVGKMYRRQLLASDRIEREMMFNEKVLANMPIGIALIDPSNRQIVQANERFIQLARQMGRFDNLSDISDIAFADIGLADNDVLERVIHYGTAFQSLEEKVIDHDGRTLYLTLNLLRLQDASHRTQGVLFLVEDVSRDRQLREELIGANAAKDQFFAALSHELRNPLSPVIAMVDELEERAKSDSSLREAVEVIKRNVQLEARLIDDLLDITRIANSKLQLNREWVNAREVLDLALEICERDARARNLRIEVDHQAEQAAVYADPARLQQVFWNLLKNAVKFSYPGGRVEVRLWNSAPDRLVVEFRDYGSGIAPSQLPRIFHAFEQGQDAISRGVGGLGLGLPISQAMVEAHGGAMTASSEGVGRGASFRIELPNARKAAEPAPEIATPAPASGQIAEGARLLLVDDHEDTLRGMSLLLARRGYRVLEAGTKRQAQQIAEQEPFDLLISDIGLPDGTGYELVAAIQKIRKVPAIALSGYGMESDIRRALESGFEAHFTKPVDIEQLTIRLSELLENGGHEKK